MQFLKYTYVGVPQTANRGSRTSQARPKSASLSIITFPWPSSSTFKFKSYKISENSIAFRKIFSPINFRVLHRGVLYSYYEDRLARKQDA